jgi:hypothetical protein
VPGTAVFDGPPAAVGEFDAPHPAINPTAAASINVIALGEPPQARAK